MRLKLLRRRRVLAVVASVVTATPPIALAGPVSATTNDPDDVLRRIGTTAVQEQLIHDATRYTGSATNVVIVISDDQPKGTVDAMPHLQNSIADLGVQINNGIIPTALCCPSRTALLTGDHSHTTGVYRNRSPNGAWPTFNESGSENDTLATRLSGLGYRTGLFGKYLNAFSTQRPDNYVPPGWDEFGSIDPDGPGDGAYYDYTLVGTVDAPHYGSDGYDYSTDVTAGYAVNFIASAGADQPLFLYWSPYGPHGPTTPAARDKGAWPLEPGSAIGALNEDNVSDKPRWIARQSKVDGLKMRRKLTQQHEALMSVDDGVGRIIEALKQTNRLHNTLIVYLSDNGFMLGAHRLKGKDLPHRRSSEVPMYMRWDGHITANSSSNRVTPQVDLTATIAEAAGISGWTMDGRSFLSTPRVGTVLEQMKFSGHPAYCGYRTARYAYIEYDSGKGRELYDYKRDPDELKDVVSHDRYSSVASRMRTAAKKACRPMPPGFSWR